MTEIKRQLREWGADPDGAIERMMNDEAFYGKMLNKFAAEDELSELGIIARQDPKEGFRIAHNLKGTAGTLGPVLNDGTGWNPISKRFDGGSHPVFC